MLGVQRPGDRLEMGLQYIEIDREPKQRQVKVMHPALGADAQKMKQGSD